MEATKKGPYMKGVGGSWMLQQNKKTFIFFLKKKRKISKALRIVFHDFIFYGPSIESHYIKK